MKEMSNIAYQHCARCKAPIYDDAPVFRSPGPTHMNCHVANLEERIDALEQALADVREVWAGSDGGEPVTCQEAYFNRLVHKCYRIAVEALKK